MAATLSLLECQRQFLAALYDERVADAAQAIAGNGLAPEARLRIYRHSSEQTHVAALRTTYPAVLALVGDAFFEQTALGYRRANRSPSGNLQAFGAGFAAYLETLAALQAWPYLPDVARLEWLRQEAALAGDAERLSVDALDRALAAAGDAARIPLRPGVRLFASRHAVLTIWRYAMQPTEARLALPPQGERVVLWRAGVVKIEDPAGTQFLFENMYHVPLLPADVAAVLGTWIELIAPWFLGLGLIGRLSALFLFVYNIVAFTSYPALWPNGFWIDLVNTTSFADHKIWALMLLAVVAWGPGALSLDRALASMAGRWRRA